MKKICVIGGGIIGMTTAYILHEAGHHVIMIDRNDNVGLGASRSNAMQLCYRTIAPYAEWGDLKKYGRYLFKSDMTSPVYVDLDISWRFLKFGLLSAYTSLPPIHKQARYKLYEMAEQSRRTLDQFRAAHPNMDFHFKQTGKIKIFEDDSSRAANEKIFEDMNRRYNAGIRVLDGDEIYEIEPALKAKHQTIKWGTYEGDTASASSGALCQQLHQYLMSSDRYEFHSDAEIKAFRRHNGRITNIVCSDQMISADYFVIAAGAGSVGLLKKVGLSIAMEPMQGYSFTLDHDPYEFNACFSDMAHKFAVNSFDGQLRVSGLMDMTGFDAKIYPARVGYLRQNIMRVFPDLNLSNAEVRTGLRPVMGGSLPVVGPRKFENLYVNTGHGVYGWTLAFGSAAKISEYITKAA